MSFSFGIAGLRVLVWIVLLAAARRTRRFSPAMRSTPLPTSLAIVVLIVVPSS
jgi:hypothetical protein